jgi:hypothetical protein
LGSPPTILALTGQLEATATGLRFRRHDERVVSLWAAIFSTVPKCWHCLVAVEALLAPRGATIRFFTFSAGGRGGNPSL